MFKPLCLIGILATRLFAQAPDSTNGWGYGYDSLLQDLARWRQSPFVGVDSIGASVQSRALWKVTVAEGGESGKQRVFVHARTHPGEVQAHYVAREMLRFLLDTTAVSMQIRKDFVFHIMPMYNPDGVELGYKRENAHHVDIESNWNNPSPEPEVLVLRGEFQRLMQKSNPVRVALNLHSDSLNCTRFFFYHEAAGTSAAYASLEQEFITGVRSHFPEGMETWSFARSWGGGTATQYPESFWWLNHREAVMALTYEDANCPNAGQYARTAEALVLGAVEYVRSHPAGIVVRRPVPEAWQRVIGFRPMLGMRRGERVFYFDLRGRLVLRAPMPSSPKP